MLETTSSISELHTWQRECPTPNCKEIITYSTMVAAEISEHMKIICDLCTIKKEISKPCVFCYAGRWIRRCKCGNYIEYRGKYARASIFRDFKKSLLCKNCSKKGKRSGMNNPNYGKLHSTESKEAARQRAIAWWKKKKALSNE